MKIATAQKVITGVSVLSLFFGLVIVAFSYSIAQAVSTEFGTHDRIGRIGSYGVNLILLGLLGWISVKVYTWWNS